MQVPELQEIVDDFATALVRVDARKPIAANARSGTQFQPGIGPHTENQTVALVLAEMATHREVYLNHVLSEPYPAMPRSRCDICLGNVQIGTGA